MLGEVVAMKAGALERRHERQPRLVIVVQRLMIAVEVVEYAELHEAAPATPDYFT